VREGRRKKGKRVREGRREEKGRRGGTQLQGSGRTVSSHKRRLIGNNFVLHVKSE
jgi:hypothetical protein